MPSVYSFPLHLRRRAWRAAGGVPGILTPDRHNTDDKHESRHNLAIRKRLVPQNDQQWIRRILHSHCDVRVC